MNNIKYNTPVYFNIQPDDLTVDKYLITKSSGYSIENTPEFYFEEIENQLSIALKNIKIHCGYVVINQKDFSLNKSEFNVFNCSFNTGKIIANQLKNSIGVILFAATVGTYFDITVTNAFLEGDSVKGLIVDTIGSELVENVGELLELFLRKVFKKYDYNLTNRLSPGYCEWNVNEQKKLFELFPDNFCGIKLNDDNLMIPLKSISGIIGYGKDVLSEDYSCNICGMEFCYKRNFLHN
ncbi:MAG TPA: vitamin B12 dependent-methionine synthase activation domain-containing protein [Melioribacteraceae bacterium]|nr:vitamin B12 dependent-methionine synthase activation domain-containing protein [Melioribacteraceae bacterium]